ncbi:PadR family transcriptional regulator [Rhodoblastus acidophilus]|uniref:PadR family transcriptional regulator n=1 Tax=Candidatus Rhodoblastus alkanivorans TaxID=2954117 RepID=A0ABS9Z5W4_9HYPH|nr:PadR family transcriptional regulator [Candidatus Rhodoblastus alkanivorans]MCI4680323.1 PadR family transcriptional regulator [Candidatus Rhodoblastus alkanivorans]MCI4682770.1 PadR family transcriptional regulator [Candidatus Rhodoblastus alkanivorans]MDI4640077.1 PadR family transcriptional regulator [Rhodoblastus acidophilus]
MLGQFKGRGHGFQRGGPEFGEREQGMSEGPFGRHFRRGRQMFEGAEGSLGRHGFGRGEKRRMFEGGALKLVFLALMETEPRHGYDLIREIETRTGGAYAPSPGIVYPTLALLEETGQIEAQASEGAKRQFRLTEAGKAFLDENRTEANAVLARLDAVGERVMPMEAGPVARAMNNLRTALQQRLAEAADKKLLFEVADIIDEAARKIERL